MIQPDCNFEGKLLSQTCCGSPHRNDMNPSSAGKQLICGPARQKFPSRPTSQALSERGWELSETTQFYLHVRGNGGVTRKNILKREAQGTNL